VTVPRLTRGVALALSLAAGCAPNAPRIGPPVRLRAWCGTLEPRPTGLYSVMSSTDDRLLDESPTAADVERAAARDDGVIAYFHAQLLALPRVSEALGESDGYARVDAVAVPPVADDATSRRIFLLVRDRGQERWIAMNAYDTADVCVEGRRQP
jgi:hypothetical protein